MQGDKSTSMKTSWEVITTQVRDNDGSDQEVGGGHSKKWQDFKHILTVEPIKFTIVKQ